MKPTRQQTHDAFWPTGHRSLVGIKDGKLIWKWLKVDDCPKWCKNQKHVRPQELP